MNRIFATLKNRNFLLYLAGWVCLVGTLGCLLAAFSSSTPVLGINAFIKPAKFFISIALFCWTMSWYTGLLPQKRQVTMYSWVVVVAMAIELTIITGQAAQGKGSHFNQASAEDALLFEVMGASITLLTGWTAYIGYLFFSLRSSTLPISYLWSIRLGIVLFVVFALEGFLMAHRLAHTVGAPDGGSGLPGLNWSTQSGDLRVAHFFGMHALQLLPLFGYYVARRPVQVLVLAVLYMSGVSFLLVEALAGKPFLASFGD